MSNQFVVSANYRDRSSQFKYLIRGKDENAKNAKPVALVRMRGVRFAPSDQYEQGFGCSTVALCDHAEGEGYSDSDTSLESLPVYESNLHFNGVGFVRDATDESGEEIVEEVEELILHPGGMFATFKAEAVPPTEEAATTENNEAVPTVSEVVEFETETVQ